MRANTLLATASAVLLTTALALERPRIYFPRRTNPGLLNSAPSLVDDIVDDIDGGFVTTIIISSTILVPPSGATTKPLPHIDALGLSSSPSSTATTSDSSTDLLSSQNAPVPQDSTHMSPGGGLVDQTTSLLGGTLTSHDPTSPTYAAATSSASSADSTAALTTDDDGLGGFLTSLLALGPEPTATAPTSSSPPDGDGVKGLLTSLLDVDSQPMTSSAGSPNAAITSSAAAPYSSTTSDADDDLFSLGGMLTNILGTATTSSAIPTTPYSATVSTSPDGDFLSDILSDVLGAPTPTSNSNTHGTSPTTTTSVHDIDDILTSLLGSPTATGAPPLSLNSTVANPTKVPVVYVTTSAPFGGSVSLTATGTAPTFAPPVSANHTVVFSSSFVSTSLPSSKVTPTSTPTSTDPLEPTSLQPTEQITSLRATATITDSQLWLPTSLIIEQTSPTLVPTQVLAPTTAQTLPSNLPQFLTPSTGGQSDQPPDTTLIQIAFKYAFNYEFLCENPFAAVQIFTYLPLALSQGEDMPLGRITIKSLVPSSAFNGLDYIMTKALVYFPTEGVPILRQDIRLPNAPLYSNPNDLIRNLTSTIDSSIDILTGEPWGYGPDESASSTPSSDSGNGTGGGVGSEDNNDDATPQDRARTVGFVVGGIAFAGVYGAGMFVVARRYKRKKQSHQRASSVGGGAGISSYRDSPVRFSTPEMAPSPDMTQGSGMRSAPISRDFSSYSGVQAGVVVASPVGGGRDSHGSGRTGLSMANGSMRSAWISAPVAAENSLGWS